MQLFEYRSVRYWSKEINARTGGKNSSGAGRTRYTGWSRRGTCQSSQWSLGSPRVGTIVRKRLHRTRRRFKHFWSILSAGRRGTATLLPWFASTSPRALGGCTTAYAVRDSHYQTYLECPPGAVARKVCNLDPMAPRSRQNVNYPRPPVVAVAVSLTHTPHR